MFITPRATHVLKNPLSFTLRVLKAFRANQGLLLAGAVAYYALLSILPLLILMVIVLSHVIDQTVLLSMLLRALEYVAPGEGSAMVGELQSFLEHGVVIGWMMFGTLLFFSSLGFRVLENAISVIFLHRIHEHHRPLLVNLLLPFGYIVFIGATLFAGTFMIVVLMSMGEEHLVLLGHRWSLDGFSRMLIYLAGLTGEILLISSVYFFMPVGRVPAVHALIGGTTAGLLWEVIRQVLGWYFGTLSQVSVMYGSLTTAIIVLLSLEVAATLLLLGAQVIAEYESLGNDRGENTETTACLM